MSVQREQRSPFNTLDKRPTDAAMEVGGGAPFQELRLP